MTTTTAPHIADRWNAQPSTETALQASNLYMWSVIPLDADKRPVKTGGTHPDGNPKRLGWKRNQTERATNQQIRAWAKRYSPPAWAIVTGALSNRVVLDFDGEQGRETLERLGLQPHRRTGSGGYHVDFKHPGWHVKTLNSKSSKDRPWAKAYPGLDIRADGGYAAFCGRNESGAYQWLRDPEADDLTLLPVDLRMYLGLEYPPSPIDSSSSSTRLEDTLLDQALSKAGIDGRDNAGFWLACQMRDNRFSYSQSESILLAYARRVPTTNTKGQYEPFTDEDARAKVRSAYNAPARDAWESPEYKPGPPPPPKSNGNGNGHHGPTETTFDLCSFSADDAGNGDAMHSLYGPEFLWCSARGWFHYTGTHWELDTDGARVRRYAVETLRKRRHAAVDAGIEAIVKCTKGDESRVNGCVSRFKTLVCVNIDSFDSNPDALNCKNGVLNLRTGTIEPHNRSQLFSYCLPVAYAPGGITEWLDYLHSVVGGGQEVIEYLQMALGYSLTGHTREETLFYLYGPTRSGKGSLAEAFMSLLPVPISTMVDFNSFTAKREGDVSNFDLAPLKPSRMIFASESNRSQSLNPAKIKQLTGGDQIRACFKHKDFFAYRPQFKVWMLSNHPVNGDPEDDALWGRVRVIEFPNSFLGIEDKSKKARLKEPDVLAGILYWTVQGAIKWYALGARGLTTPESIKKTTQAHRAELDYVQQWLDACCEEYEEKWVANEEVIKSYTDWCKSNNVQYAKSPVALSQSLKAKGYQIGVQKKIDGKNRKGVVGFYIYPIEKGNGNDGNE